jgi:tRNA threonylcarbamoyladenosine biosynthesis protein TsaE
VIFLAGPEETEAAGHSIAAVLQSGDIIALSGGLGAGKTSFTRGILKGLGFTEEVPSPSFALVLPYEPPAVRLPLWHVDLYRIENAADVEALGLDEVLHDGVLVIEWPERLEHRLWPEALRLAFDPVESGGRRLTVTLSPSWEGRCPFQ